MQYENCGVHGVCALLLDSLARNHGFVEGNKRTALVTIAMTYSMNGVNIDFDAAANKEYEAIVLEVVLQKPTIPEIAKKLEELCERHKAGSVKEFIEKLAALILGKR